MKKLFQNLAVVIPSLDPNQTLVTYIAALSEQGFEHIYVVNDGSSSEYDHIFQTISRLKGCTLLIHTENRGKGAALKTAYQAISQQLPHCRGIITADSDGQHAVRDVCRMAEALQEGTEGLLLGGRDFAQGNTPMKSYVGNRLSSLLFFLLHGNWVQDTQTGLRGFQADLIPEMLDIPGDRFEYEMAVLTTFCTKKYPIHCISIDTIYIEGNASTHFRPLVDSLRIGRVLLDRLWRFMMSSGISCIIDVAMCWLFLHLLTAVISSDLLRIGLSVVLARAVSMVVNYTINRGFVFRAKDSGNRSFRRYLLLVVANMVASTAFIYLAHTLLHMDERLAKAIADTILFIINYQIQRIWVFPTENPGGTT